jgi:hypothetical protein
MEGVSTLSLKALQKVLKYSHQEIRKLGKQISAAVIRGSMEIWRQDPCGRHDGHLEQEQEIIQEEVTELRGLDPRGELPTSDESDEDDKIDEGDGMDQPKDEEQAETSHKKHRMEQEDQRDQLQMNGSWIRESEDQGRGEVRHRENVDGDQGRRKSGRADDPGIMANDEGCDLTD